MPGWVDEVAALADGEHGVLQHFELTDTGPTLCRSENFVPVHAGLRTLLCTGVLVEVAGALLGEPAVLYKEKVNYKLPGGAGYSPHQDAPAYPMIDVHVSAMVAVDDADESNGGLEVVSRLLRRGAAPRRARVHRGVASSSSWSGSRCRCAPGQTLWFHSRTPHRSGPNHSRSAAPSALPHLQRRARGRPPRRVLRRRSAPRSRAAPAGDRARVSLIGDFEGRPV